MKVRKKKEKKEKKEEGRKKKKKRQFIREGIASCRLILISCMGQWSELREEGE